MPPEPHATAKQLTNLATPSRRVSVTKDTKIPNAATLIIEREDHTLGNALRM